MTDTTNPPPVVNLENCTCLEKTFFDIGVQTGLEIRKMIQVEIANNMSSIENLRKLLELLGPSVINPGAICTKNQPDYIPPDPNNSNPCC